ncbi:MAG TPA: hypothetical protein DEG69_21480 [Flavobacteriaceae bacterium]|nr:hypothetical protein [Flavobacteriaceae bacterium]
MFYLFWLITFIAVIILFSRTGVLHFALEYGLTISVSVTAVVYFHNLFWITYEECLDKEAKKSYTIKDE